MSDKPWKTDADGLYLVLGQCGECAHTFFPPQQYGCESCGSAPDRLTTLAVPAVGTVAASVTVGAHPVLPTPFVIGDIVLDRKSVVVQVLLTSSPAVGERVVGRVESDGNDESVVFVAEREPV